MIPLLEMATATHPGRVRSQNEDCVVLDAQAGFAVLGDGMGGHNAGEVASRMAVDRVSSEISKSRDETALDASRAEALIAGHVRSANTAVYQAALAQPAYEGMGTTLIVVLWHDGQMSVGHVGDSRLYRLRQSKLEQLTRDHSLVQEQLDRGAISRERARYAANRNVLTRAVGVDPEVEVETGSYATEPDDIYLLCSDGLSDMLTDSKICETLVSLHADIDSAARRLVQQANDNGGLDNISVILVRVARDGRSAGR